MIGLLVPDDYDQLVRTVDFDLGMVKLNDVKRVIAIHVGGPDDKWRDDCLKITEVKHYGRTLKIFSLEALKMYAGNEDPLIVFVDSPLDLPNCKVVHVNLVNEVANLFPHLQWCDWACPRYFGGLVRDPVWVISRIVYWFSASYPELSRFDARVPEDLKVKYMTPLAEARWQTRHSVRVPHEDPEAELVDIISLA